MRLRKGSIRGRVKADLPIKFTREKLSAHGGLELFRRFVDRSGFADRLRDIFSIRQFDSDYGSFRVTLALIGMLLLGGTRLRHLRVLRPAGDLDRASADIKNVKPADANFVAVAFNHGDS